MKYINFITGGVLFALLLAGCSDEFEKEPIVLPVSGDEIEFGAAPGGFTDVNPESRTIYDVPAGSTFDNYTLLNIKWQYDIDQVRVYCPEGADGFKTADYTVKETTDASSGTSTGFLVKNGETGVRWGNTGETHNFYAFYSLDRIGEGLQTGTTVTATIPTGQEGGKLLTYNNEGKEDSNGTFKIITPDMSFCMMAGKGTWTPGTDKVVALTFTPIVTVLDVLINGPKDGDVEFMNIVSVSVRSKSGKNIVGTFSYDVAKGEYDFSETDNSQTATSIATVQTIIDNNPVELKQGQQLNVKFFLLPRDISEGDLVVSVLTEGGVVYSKTITGTGTTPDGGDGDGVLKAGLITRIKTPKLVDQEANNWMSQIPDNVLFSQLSLPGSKHAFSYNTAESFDPNTGISHYYQALPPLEIRSGETATTTQFDEGVRVFDVHLNLTDDNTNAIPIVYAGGANLNPQYTLSQVLDALNKKVNPENETPSECAVVFLNYVHAATSNVSTWLSAVMNSLNSWNSSHKTTDGKDILTKIDGTTTIGAVRGKIAVIINLRTADKPSGSVPVNYINNFSTSVQNIDIVTAPYNGTGVNVRIQNLQQCNNPSFTDGGGYAFRSGIGVIPYFIAVKNHDDSKVSCNLLDTKKNLMKKLNQEIAEGGTDLYINDLSGFCVTKNRESTGYAHYGTVTSAAGGAYVWWSDHYVYDYKDFSDYTVVSSLDEIDFGFIGRKENVCLDMAEIGNGGNTCLFAELFNGEAVTEYSSLVGGLRQPLGIVLMNFAGVANVTIGTRNYAVQGIRLPGLIMMNNFMFPLKTGTTKAESSSKVSYSKGGDLWD
ncbi:hypothetical protein [uncultured Bacteroides sp.]|uniref:hypothetical protein n=1 Tax=uncultured Bacteroides sp. TaxID=162156 RepID=UPI00260CA89E|nr:hypothetical protein [uncultured Bacteroides sp.]